MSQPIVASHPTPDFLTLLTATRLTRTADGLKLIDGATLTVNAGDRIALLGPSGSGKTVLLRVLSMLDPVDHGTITWQSKTVQDTAVPEFRSRVLYLHQQPALNEGTVESVLREPFELTSHGNRQYARERALQWVAAVGKPASFLDQRAADLSGGEQQIAALVRALLLEPNILLLDEPTSAIDVDATKRVETVLLDWVQASDARAYLWVTHDAEQAERIANRRLSVAAGRIEAD